MSKLNINDLHSMKTRGVCQLEKDQEVVGFKKVRCDYQISEKTHYDKECLVQLLIKGRPIVKSDHHYTEKNVRNITPGNKETHIYSHDYTKYRTDEAYVDTITTCDVNIGKEAKILDARSIYQSGFKYQAGQTVKLRPNEKLDTENVVCGTSGIHFFLNLEDAVFFYDK